MSDQRRTTNLSICVDDYREHLDIADEADLILTDPPYNIGFDYGDHETAYTDQLTDDEYIDLLSPLRDRPLAIIHYPEEAMRWFVPALGVPDEVIVWAYPSNLQGRQSRLVCLYGVKPNWRAVPQPYRNPSDKRVRALIEAGSPGARSYDWWTDVNLVKNVSKGAHPHPCPVPVELMRRIIVMTTDPGSLVVDPFAGSGSTGVAAIKSGRRFAGFEVDPVHAATGNQRLDEYLSTEHEPPVPDRSRRDE